MKNSSQAPEQNDWQEFKPLFGGGKIKICDTLRAVTPFGGLSVLIEFFGRIGLVEQLENRQFYQSESPNHYDPGQILVGFMLSVIAGAQRFAHTNQLRADRALHALLGIKRFPSDDTFFHRRFGGYSFERGVLPFSDSLAARSRPKPHVVSVSAGCEACGEDAGISGLKVLPRRKIIQISGGEQKKWISHKKSKRLSDWIHTQPALRFGTFSGYGGRSKTRRGASGRF